LVIYEYSENLSLTLVTKVGINNAEIGTDYSVTCVCRTSPERNIVSGIDIYILKGDTLLTIGYMNFSHVTIVFIAKYLFTGSVKILNKIVFEIAIKFISMRNPEISYCLYSKKFKETQMKIPKENL
jgi:hypothetical protein